MLARWTRYLPYAVVLWMAKRYAMRVDLIMPGHQVAQVYDREAISWWP